MAKIRLELEGRPGSFFEAEVKGSELHVSFGARDRIAPTKARPFPSEAAAKAECERLLGLHRTKGYVERVEAPVKPKGPTPQEQIAEARNRSEWLAARQTEADRRADWKLVEDDALLAACEAAPDDPAPWHVYADRLAAGGDPRGELALGLLRGLEWEGKHAMHAMVGEHTVLEIQHGFLRAAKLAGDDPVELARFLETPFAASLRKLRVGLAEQGDWSVVLEVISRLPAGCRLRELEFDASDRLVRDIASYTAKRDSKVPDQEDYDDYSDYNVAYDQFIENFDDEIRKHVAAVCPVRFDEHAPWSKLVALERLVIDGPFRGDLGPLELPALRELVIRSDRFDRFTDLARAQCPRLETLEIWFGDQVWSGETGTLEPSPLFAPGVLPSLKTLRVYDAHEDTLAMIARLAKRVKVVELDPESLDEARYAHPHIADRMPMNLPRGGEPPKAKAKKEKEEKKEKRTKKPKA